MLMSRTTQLALTTAMLLFVFGWWAQVASAHTITRSDCYQAAKASGYPYQSYYWKVALRKCQEYRAAHNYNHKCPGVAGIIRCTFKRAGDAAVRVARCESGLSTTVLGPKDEYGNYRLGLFQLGTYERSVAGPYTRWSSAKVQATSGYHYYILTGADWGAWECRP